MTKILYVYGDDYAASTFDKLVEKGELTAALLWEAGSGEYDNEDDYFEFEALEYGAVDPEFIEWVQGIQDYDDSKHANFYVVGD